jgi:hypothetical protein
MNKEDLLKTLKRLLVTENNLDYLLKLTISDLEALIACIRDRVDHKKP